MAFLLATTDFQTKLTVRRNKWLKQQRKWRKRIYADDGQQGSRVATALTWNWDADRFIWFIISFFPQCGLIFQHVIIITLVFIIFCYILLYCISKMKIKMIATFQFIFLYISIFLGGAYGLYGKTFKVGTKMIIGCKVMFFFWYDRHYRQIINK